MVETGWHFDEDGEGTCCLLLVLPDKSDLALKELLASKPGDLLGPELGLLIKTEI